MYMIDLFSFFPNSDQMMFCREFVFYKGYGDNDQRSKHFCSIAVLCVSFT